MWGWWNVTWLDLLRLPKTEPSLLASGFRNNRLGNPPLPRSHMSSISAGKPVVSILSGAADR